MPCALWIGTGGSTQIDCYFGAQVWLLIGISVLRDAPSYWRVAPELRTQKPQVDVTTILNLLPGSIKYLINNTYQFAALHANTYSRGWVKPLRLILMIF